MADYSIMKDEEVVNLVHEGDFMAQDYLLNKYKTFVKKSLALAVNIVLNISSLI